MGDQRTEANPRVVSISKWPLSYPTASVHVAGAGNYPYDKPIMQWKYKQKMSKEIKNDNQPNKVDLSDRARENLRQNAESRQNDSRFMKLQPGEKKNVQINPEGIRQTIADFNGNKTKRYEYPLIDLGSGSSQEKYLTVGKRTSEDIDAFLLEGQNRLKIQRLGLGKDTRYIISAIN